MAVTCRVFFDYELPGDYEAGILQLTHSLQKHGIAFQQQDSPGGPGKGVIRRGRDGDLSAVRIDFDEDVSGVRARSRIILVRDGAQSVVWAEQSLPEVAASGTMRLPAVPVAVRALLASGGARCGPVSLTSQARRIEGTDALRDVLDATGGPPVVVAHAPAFGGVEGVIRELETRLTGSAAIVELSGDAVPLLRPLLGDTPFPRGAVGLFLPGTRSMRVSPSAVAARQPEAVARQLQRGVLDYWLRQPVPAIIRERALRLPGFPEGPAGGDSELLDLYANEVERLQRRLSEAEGNRDLGILELDEALRDLDQYKRRSIFLEKRLTELNDFAAGIEETGDELPTEVDSCSTAIELARQFLPRVVIGMDASTAAAELDQYPEASVWAKKAWQAFQSLNDYAEKKRARSFIGTFLDYCIDPPALAAPIPAGQVALNESESTNAQPACRRARTFAVPAAVSAQGSVYMAAHIKIQRAGGCAPRVHFWDDTRGTSGLVYVGYFGKHLPTGGQ